jgi:phospholipase C
MASLSRWCAASLFLAALASPAHGDGDLKKVNHVVIVMQENHSFDNYFGALPYAPGGPYHPGPCSPHDHACVDGLSCTAGAGGTLKCTNANRDDDRRKVAAFHAKTYCPGPDLRHDWPGSHQ